MQTKPESLTVKPRGFERSALVVRGHTTVAEVFTDREPGDQYQTAALFAAAPELLDALQRVLRHIPADAGGASLSDDIHRARRAIARATGDA